MKEEKTDRQKEKKDRQIGKNINTKRKKKTNEQKEKKTADRILSKCNHHHNHHHHHHYIQYSLKTLQPSYLLAGS